jgi:nitrite reductase (NADH) small subunit
MRWIEIGNVSDIPRRGARCVQTVEGKIAVFRTAEDRIFAIEDHCPHRGGPLSQGIVHGAAVTCPLHNWAISLETGKALGADQGAESTLEVKVENGRLFLNVEARETCAA